MFMCVQIELKIVYFFNSQFKMVKLVWLKERFMNVCITSI